MRLNRFVFLLAPCVGCAFPSSPSGNDDQFVPPATATGGGTFVDRGVGGMPTQPPPTAGTGGATAAPTPDGETVTACGSASAQMVTTAAQLKSALAAAKPGTVISIAPGSYVGDFVANASGTTAQPITLCGSENSVVSADSPNQNSLDIKGDYWVLSGFTLKGGLRGVVLDGANFCTLTGLTVHGTGQEAIHLLAASSDNMVEKCRIYDTGKATADFGEGIYLGSAKSNWSKYTGSPSVPDRSNRNKILNNVIGPNVRAEHIDVKEGTEGGIIRGNQFDGAGLSGDGYADSWIDVKGNDYMIEENTGDTSPQDGFQVRVIDNAYGHNNRFRNNVAKVNGPGYGFWISGDSNGTIVSCTNQVSGAAKGLSNQGCAVD